MTVQAMAKGLRVTLTPTLARTLAQLLERHGDADVQPLATAMRRGLEEVHAKGAVGRARKAEARAKRAAEPRSEGLEVDGHRVRAIQGDYYDTGHDPDAAQWRRIRPDEPWQAIPAQTEIRRGWWMVHVFDTDLRAIGADALVADLADVADAARAIIAQAVA